jgi:hypothetical protein
VRECECRCVLDVCECRCVTECMSAGKSIKMAHEDEEVRQGESMS